MKKLFILPAIVLLFLGSCKKAEDGKNSLIDMIVEPQGSNCATGGHKVVSGLDVNSDGILQEGEITATKYVCNGVAGSNSLISFISESAGSNCTTGGYKLNSGVDLNKNNILDASEITSSQYICNGLTGNNSLISLTTELAGGNCSTGGYKINSGVDVNKNGTLDNSEVQSTKYICNGANGLNYLIGVVAQSAGTTCTYGGYRFNTGIDLNSNGILDNNEITKSDYLCHDAPTLSVGLIAHWPFNGNGNDLSGNNRTASLFNLASTADRFGNATGAYLFNGVSSYASVADHSALRLSNTDFTLNTWVKLSSYNPSFGSILFNKRLIGVNNGWSWSATGHQSSPTGRVSFGPGGGSLGAFGSIVFNLNSWHMLTTVYNNSTGQVNLYVDGVLDSMTTGIPTPNGSVTNNLHIGNDSSTNGYFLHGALDDIRIYSRALTNTEVLQLYNSSN